MRIDELTTESKPLLEGKNLQVFEALLPLFLLNEEGEGAGEPAGDTSGPPEVPDLGTQPTPPTTPVGSGWYRPGPFRPGGGMSGNHWFNQLYSTLKTLAVASNISKRLKELGIKGEGVKRIRMAQKVAAKHVKLLLTNPGATAYRIPVWTTAKPPKVVIKKWNEEYSKAFAKELGKVDLMENYAVEYGATGHDEDLEEDFNRWVKRMKKIHTDFDESGDIEQNGETWTAYIKGKKIGTFDWRRGGSIVGE